MILITGANGGIGQHVLRYLLAQGEREVVALYRHDREKLAASLAEAGLDPDRHAYCCDLTDEDSVTAVQARIQAEHGTVTRLVNVAGSSSNGMSWKLSRADFMRVMEDNVLSAFLCCKAFVPGMREARYGRIVNFSSIVGFTGIAGAAHYAAAKAALAGLTKSLALELAGRGITVNALALGYFDAGLIHSVPAAAQEEIRNRIPMARFGDQEAVGSAVAYLLAPGSGFLTGQVVHLNGGQF